MLSAAVLSGMAVSSFAQQGGLNQKDASGKKDGKWILYYNSYFKVVDDSTKAAYYFFTYYDHGTRVHTHAQWGTKSGEIVCSQCDSSSGSRVKLLSGEYKIFKKGNLFAVLLFDKGAPVIWKQYYPSGQLYLLFDYTRHINNEPLSYTLYEYSKDGSLKSTISIGKENNWGNIR
jgi:hypothetical protein